jgi:hypothetical protein
MRLYICIPSHDTVCADFLMSVTALINHLFTHTLDGVDDMSFKLLNQRGSLIHMSREQMAAQALAGGATHILWLDSDMMFPEGALHRLYSRGEPIAAANYVQRCLPTKPNAVTKLGTPCFTRKESTGTEVVKSVGMGLCLIDADVFRNIERPWFDTYWYEDERGNRRLIGEDVFFFHKAAHAGYHAVVDHDLSKEVVHLGMFEFTHPMALIE